jgi:dTDP-glucose 4,6-dehydratase
MPKLPDRDIQEVLRDVPWKDLKGAKILLSGGSGFVGSWMVDTFYHANLEYELGATMTVLTRDTWKTLRGMVHLPQNGSVTVRKADLADSFPSLGCGYTHIVHAASENHRDRLYMHETIVEGTKKMLEAAYRDGVHRFLYLSSGAAAKDLDSMDPENVYGISKKAAENLCTIFVQRGLHVAVARGYTFSGPRLPLGKKFALGEFVEAGLKGMTIGTTSGNTVRSYLYASDMATWLWKILLKFEKGSVTDVGSDRPVSMDTVSSYVAALCGVNHNCYLTGNPDTYYPGSRDGRLLVKVPFEEGVERMVDWYRHNMPKDLDKPGKEFYP